MSEISINRNLRNVLLAGAVWDNIGGIIFLFVHGVFQVQLTPIIHPFYAIVTGIFLFLLAHIQYICAANIETNVKIIGSVIFFRVFYTFAVILFSFLVEQLPIQFFIIALVDTILVILLLLFATIKGKFTVGVLFKI